VSEVVGIYNVSGSASGTTVSGGTANFTGTLTSVGAQVVVNGGTANFSRNVSTAQLTVESSGTLTGSAAVTVTKTFTWSSGTLSGTGSTTVAGGGTMNLNGTFTTETLDGRTLTLGVGATATWSGTNSLSFGDGAVFNNQGTFTIQNDQTINVFGATPTINNTGTFTKTAGVGTTVVNAAFNNGHTVSVQSGELDLLGGGHSNAGTFTTAARSTLGFTGTNVLGAVSGMGAVRFSGGAADVSGTYAIGGATTVANGAAVNFIGAVSSGAFSNAGTVTIGTGIHFAISGDYTQTAGVTNLDGATLAASHVNVVAGLFSGLGTIVANVSNAAVIVVGGTGTAGLLSITGNYTQTSAGSLDMEIGGNSPGTQFDELAISGSATLGGTLNVSFINGFAPASGTWRLLTFASRTGTFAQTNIGNGKSVTYAATNVTVS
jgi:hypothetical protein